MLIFEEVIKDYIEARKGAHSAFKVSHSEGSSQSSRD